MEKIDESKIWAIDFIKSMYSWQSFDLSMKSMPKNTGELAVLTLLKSTEKQMASGEIAYQLKAKTSRVAAILKALENKGQIFRVHPKEDKRITLVALTEKGKKLCDDTLDNITSKLMKCYEKFGREEMDRFKETFLKLLQFSREDYESQRKGERKCFD